MRWAKIRIYGIEVTVEGLVGGQTIEVKTTGSQTEVGKSANTYTIDWKSSEATAKENNYEVSESLGTLTVTAAAAKQSNKTTTGSGTRSSSSSGGSTTTKQATAKTGDANY